MILQDLWWYSYVVYCHQRWLSSNCFPFEGMDIGIVYILAMVMSSGVTGQLDISVLCIIFLKLMFEGNPIIQ